MREKHRNVSGDNYFHQDNKPPLQYLTHEKILEKPGRINLKGIDTSRVPLAGKLGEIGKLIIEDPKHVSYFTTGPWDVEYHEHKPRTIHGKSVKPLAEKSVNIDMQSMMKHANNFSSIHRQPSMNVVPDNSRTAEL